MIKVKVVTVDKPDCFVGIDLSLFDKVNKACEQLRRCRSLLSPCGEISTKMIFLYDCNDQLFRIRILSVINPNTFKCLLIDHGRIEEVQKHRLCSVPPNSLEIDPAVKLFKIPGVTPAGLSISSVGVCIKANLSESKEWIRASYKFVCKIFRENPMVFVTYLKSYSQDKAFVEVMVNYNNERMNLKDLLILENYAFALTEEQDIDNIDVGLENISMNAYEENVEDDCQSSLSGESISKILEEGHDDDDDNSEFSRFNDTPQLSIAPENYDGLVTNTSTFGTLDEISLQVLNNKVKSWFLTKSIVINSNEERVIKYEYRNPIRPILSYQKDEMIAPFLKDTMVHYKTKLLLLIQSLMIPSILRGINLVAIAPSKKGKSLGMLMPIIQKIATKNVSRTRSFNPIAIIICTSWLKVKELTDAAKLFIGFINESSKIRKPTVVSAFAGQLETKVMIPILSGCDILIITPKCLLRLLKTHEFFKLNELEIMGLDDAENLIAHHLVTLKEIFIYKQSGSYESGVGVLQVVTATNWTSGLQSFVQNEMGNMFMIAVNNPLEIAVFEQLKHKLVEYDNGAMDLYQKLLTYLQMTESTIKRTIIFASDDRRIRSIYRFLMQKVPFDLKLMVGTMSGAELRQVQDEWNQYRGYLNMPVLLISDEALGSSEVSIFNAQTIIHADINPDMFGQRINFLRDRFAQLSFLHPVSTTEHFDTSYHSFILVSPSTIELTHANFLYKFLGRCHCERPLWLQEKAIDYFLNKEKCKLVNAICPHIKMKGECQFPGCNKRHIVLSDVDKPLLPNRGQLKFRVLHLKSPSNFFVRIMDHKVANEDSVCNYKSQYTTLKMNIIKYFSDIKNVQGVNPKFIKPGFIAAIRQKDILERVMVLKLKSNRSARMSVSLIDNGATMIVEQADLLTLPKDLQEVPAQAIEVFVIGIRPLDNDEYYHEESCKYAQEFLSGKDLHGVIMLCIGKTLWLDSVTQLVHHKTTNITVFEKSLSIELSEKSFAEKNPGHIQKLIRLCTGKIDIWNSSIQGTESGRPIPLMRSFTYTNEPLKFESLEIQSEDDDDIENQCIVQQVLSPNIIYLSNRDTKESIKQMQKEIKSLIDSIEVINFNNLKVSSRVLFCHDSEWLRGLILRIDANSVLIFSLDWGSLVNYTRHEYPLRRLPSEYQELPYHIIVAGLHHCNNTQPFSDDVNTIIENFVSSSNTKILLSVTSYFIEDLEVVSDTIIPFYNTELCQSLKRYSVSIAKKAVKDEYVELFNTLVQRNCVVPSQSWIHVVLPESMPMLSLLERSNSIPHLASEVLSTLDVNKRLKLSMNIERIINKNINFFKGKGFVSSYVDTIMNTLFVLLHFVSEQSVFMCYYRSFVALLNLAYTDKLPLNSSSSEEAFCVTYIGDLVYSYQSMVTHMLAHFNITIRNERLEDCAVFLDLLRVLLASIRFTNSFFEEDSWVCVMATGVALLADSDQLYNRLMDILVQLVMLSSQNEGAILAGVVAQCCQTVARTASGPVWHSSMALVSCVINCKQYYCLFRQLDFFSALFDKTMRHFQTQGHRWSELHEAALELLQAMWTNGAVDRRRSLLVRDLAAEVRSVIERVPSTGHESLAKFLTDIVLEQSAVTTSGSSEQQGPASRVVDGRDAVSAPDTDAWDWVANKANPMLKKHKKSFKKIFQDEHSSQSSDDRGSIESDSDSSNVEVTNFLTDTNPANEDNVHCYDLP